MKTADAILAQIAPDRDYTAAELAAILRCDAGDILRRGRRGQLPTLPRFRGQKMRFMGRDILSALAANGFGLTAPAANDRGDGGQRELAELRQGAA